MLLRAAGEEGVQLRRDARPWTRGAGALVTSLALVTTACYPTTRMQTPRTTPPGKVHGAIGFGVAPSEAAGISFAPDVALRVGVHDRVDLSLRARAAAIELGPKVQLLRDDLELSIAAAFLAAQDDDLESDESNTRADHANVLAGRASIYVGTNADADWSVFAAPTIDVGQRSYTDFESTSELLLAPGFLAGLVLAPNPSARFFLEFGMLFPAGGPHDGGRLAPGDRRLEFNFGLMLGRNADR